LVVAKLDRLARNTRFLLSIVDGAGDAGVVFCDLPALPAGPVGKFMLTQMAAVAELEAGLISQRTKAALAAARDRGTKLGGFRGYRFETGAGAEGNRKKATAFATKLGPMLCDLHARGLSLRAIASELNGKGVLSPAGKGWTATTVQRCLARMEPPTAVAA
jgi:DNA invertase Pin-like site-specific DNA recombinase